MLDIILRIGHHATGEDALDDRAISGWVQSAMKKLRALRRDRQKVTGDEVSEAMVKAGTADGTWIGAVTMVAGIAWNWVWHRHRRGA